MVNGEWLVVSELVERCGEWMVNNEWWVFNFEIIWYPIEPLGYPAGILTIKIL